MSKPTVLITGATGHLGFKTLITALEAGYRARVALRRLEQAEKIKQAASTKPHLDSIEFVQVPDITAPNAYDEAVKGGVDYVLHIASPIFSVLSPDDNDWQKLLYDPAQKGQINMLSAAAKEPSVKRVVTTSSVGVLEPKNGSDIAGPYDIRRLPDAETMRALPTSAQAYGVSKVLAHTVANDFMERNKVHFDLVRVVPGYIQGANELYKSAADMRNEAILGSNEGTMLTALGVKVGHPRITHQAFLDDVAKAHVLALQAGVKSGDNILVAGNNGVSVPWEDIAEVIKAEFPEAVAKGILNPKAEDMSLVGKFDIASSEKALGFKFAGPETWMRSVVGQYLDFVGSA